MNLDKVDPVVREMYDDIDAKLLPFIKSKAHRFSGLEFDDVVQEARLALLLAMHKFDYNRANGDYVPYLKTVVINVCRGLFSKQRQRSKVPWVAKYDGQDWTETPTTPISIDSSEDIAFGVIDEKTQDCETSLCFRHSALRIQSFRNALEKELAPFELSVFRCRVDLPAGLIVQVQRDEGDINNPSNLDIAKYLGTGKNQVDWALHKIKVAFTKMAEKKEFSDVFGRIINDNGWPGVHISKGTTPNYEFVNRTIQQRKLDVAAIRVVKEYCESGTRTVITYGWGVVLFVEYEVICWTAVLEGTFNVLSGDIFGKCGARKGVSIEGYKQLAKELVEVRSKEMSDKYKELEILPHCVCEYEAKDETCNGSEDEPPCIHRDHCVALQLRMQLKGMKKTQYVEEKVDIEGSPYCAPKNLLSFGKVITGMIRAYGIKDGTATRKPKVDRKLANKQKKKKEELKKVKKDLEIRPKSVTVMDPWFERTLVEICEGTGKRFEPDPDKQEPDTIFIRDRRLKSNYVGIYYKPPKGRGVPLCLLRYKSKNTLMDFSWPIKPDEFEGVNKAIVKELDPIEFKDGLFLSVSKNLGNAALSLATETLIQLIATNVIEMPE